MSDKKPMPTQFGHVVTGDFEDNTITLKIEGDMIIAAGKYAVVPIEEYEKMVEASKDQSELLKAREIVGKMCDDLHIGDIIEKHLGKYSEHLKTDE